MPAVGARLARPVQSLRWPRRCRSGPQSKALEQSNIEASSAGTRVRIKEELEEPHSPHDSPAAAEPVGSKRLKVEVKSEPEAAALDCDGAGDEKCEPLPNPDGHLEVDQDELDLERTLLGGQSFRWKMSPASNTRPTIFTGVASNHVVQLWRCDDTRVAYRRLNTSQAIGNPSVEEFLGDYFQLKYKLRDLYEEWSQRDEHFKRSSVNYRGFRILRQDPVENVFSFICATNNNIKRISLMIDKMCQHFGDHLEVEGLSHESPNPAFHSFPSVERLAQDDVFDMLRYKLGFGYRAKFICETAKRLATMGTQSQKQPRELLLNLRQLPYKETCKRLQEFPGIGRKVADCICLMSMDHLGSVPIDCHIYEIVCRNYMTRLRQERKTLTEAVHDLIGQYFTGLHGPLAGWATSVLFIGELKHLKQETSFESTKTKTKRAPNKRSRGSDE